MSYLQVGESASKYFKEDSSDGRIKDTLSEEQAGTMIKSMLDSGYPKREPNLDEGVSVAHTTRQPIGKNPDSETRVVVGTPEGAVRGTGEFKDLISMPDSADLMASAPQMIETEDVNTHAVEDEENNYRKVLCPHCLIQEFVGCDHCGIFQYAWKRNEYRIKVTKQD